MTHAVLTGLTPLIPVPFVDDLIEGAFVRAMVTRLAERQGRELSDEQIRALTVTPGRGFWPGIAGKIALYPAKKLFRKAFYLLEWKRAADLISVTYYRGFLLDVALRHGWIELYGAEAVRAASDIVLQRTNTSPIQQAATGVVSGSRGLFQSLGALLRRKLPDSPDVEPREIEQAAANVQADDGPLARLVAQLQERINGVPAEHFEHLREQMKTELERA